MKKRRALDRKNAESWIKNGGRWMKKSRALDKKIQGAGLKNAANHVSKLSYRLSQIEVKLNTSISPSE
jgi:hypothetical protein